MSTEDRNGPALNDERWEAVVACDPAYDGAFFYAVRSTGIFCRPSCRSRTPLREHVRLFRHAEQAEAEGYRPCKRCKPERLCPPEEEWTAAIAGHLDARYAEALTLQRLSDLIHVSPFHLQRTFKRLRGQTPAGYLKRVRMERAGRLLAETHRTVTDIAAAVGIPNTAYFATLFRQHTGMTPSAYRSRNSEAAARDLTKDSGT